LSDSFHHGAIDGQRRDICSSSQSIKVDSIGVFQTTLLAYGIPSNLPNSQVRLTVANSSGFFNFSGTEEFFTEFMYNNYFLRTFHHGFLPVAS